MRPVPALSSSRSSAPATTIEGLLERVTFSNDENAWSVVKLVVAGKADLVTAVGNLLGVQPGESLRLSGRWTTDKKYGEQFRVDSYVTVKPATLVGIEKYLGSGLVRGVGKVMAERLVGHFGLETLEVIDQKPERLVEVEGIGPVRSERITKAWVEQRQIKDVMVFLQSHGVSTTYATRIYKQYRDRSIAVVRDNPYRLAIDILGIGFKSADKIASQLGIEPTSPLRAAAGVLHVLRNPLGRRARVRNYDLNVFNGDIGRVRAIDPVEQEVQVEFDGKAVTYDYSDLDELVLAYACSIHKSQGSEYPCVVIPVHTQHFMMLQRNLLYTGITRGKRLVILVGSKRALAIAVKNNSTKERCTMLAERLRRVMPHRVASNLDAIL
jgi:ATP-dependent exoDNAse (exonuclease V) alpha subunit